METKKPRPKFEQLCTEVIYDKPIHISTESTKKMVPRGNFKVQGIVQRIRMQIGERKLAQTHPEMVEGKFTEVQNGELVFPIYRTVKITHQERVI